MYRHPAQDLIHHHHPYSVTHHHCASRKRVNVDSGCIDDTIMFLRRRRPERTDTSTERPIDRFCLKSSGTKLGRFSSSSLPPAASNRTNSYCADLWLLAINYSVDYIRGTLVQCVRCPCVFSISTYNFVRTLYKSL